LRRLLIPFEVFRIGVARLTAAWGARPHTALQNILRELAAEKKRAEPQSIVENKQLKRGS
jgi:hypothetical protein